MDTGTADTARYLEEGERRTIRDLVKETSLAYAASQLGVTPNTVARVALAGMRGHRGTILSVRMGLESLKKKMPVLRGDVLRR